MSCSRVGTILSLGMALDSLCEMLAGVSRRCPLLETEALRSPLGSVDCSCSGHSNICTE